MSIRQKLHSLSNRTLLGMALAAVAVLILTLAWRFSNKPEPIIKPMPAPQVVSTASVPAPAPQTDIVLDLFNPSDSALSDQLSESALKSRLEEVMTTAFILKRCGRLNDSDYNDTYRALMTYAQKMQPTLTTQQVQDNFNAIIASASASYGLIYARLSCKTPELATSAAQLAQWRETILNPPPQ